MLTGDSWFVLRCASLKRRWFKPLLSLVLIVLLLVFPRLMEVFLSFTLLIHMLGFSDGFLQRIRFIILYPVFVKGWQSTHKPLNLDFLIFYAVHIPHQVQELLHIFIHSHASHLKIKEFLHLPFKIVF